MLIADWLLFGLLIIFVGAFLGIDYRMNMRWLDLLECFNISLIKFLGRCSYENIYAFTRFFDRHEFLSSVPTQMVSPFS